MFPRSQYLKEIIGRKNNGRLKIITGLLDKTYLKDVLDRHKVLNNEEVLTILLDVIASGVGALTNPSKLSGIS